MNILAISLIVLTCLLLAFPLFFFFRYLRKWISLLSKKSRNARESRKATSHLKSYIIKKAQSVKRYVPIRHEDEKNIPLHTDQVIAHQKLHHFIQKILSSASDLKEKWYLVEYEKKLIEWLALDPQNQQFLKMLSQYYFNKWKLKKSLSLLKKIVDLYPDDHNSLWLIWEIYLEKWDFDVAQRLIWKAVSLQPTTPKYYISLVELYYNKQRLDDAIAVMEKVIRLRPTNTNYMVALAELYEESGNIDLARKYYFKILEFEPTHKKARKKIQY